MKRLLCMLCAVVAICTAYAQPPMPPGHRPADPKAEAARNERMRRSVERMKQALDMTDKQAEQFVPVYQAYTREINGIRKDLKMLMDYYKDKPTDKKTAMKLVMVQLDADAEIIKAKKEYLRLFKMYLTPEQLSKVFLLDSKPARPHRQGPGGPGAPDPKPDGRPDAEPGERPAAPGGAPRP